MSSDFHISLYCTQNDVPVAFAALIKRAVECGIIDDVYVEDTWGTRVPQPTEAGRLHDLATSAMARDECLVVRMQYRLRSGGSIPLEFVANSAGYRRGLHLSMCGPIVVHYCGADLLPTSYTPSESAAILRANELLVEGVDRLSSALQRVPEHVVNSGIEALRDVEGLFCHLLQLERDTSSSGGYISAAMYADFGWPSPADCLMICHRSPREYARDFARIYADYHWGTRVTRTFVPEVLPTTLAEMSRLDWEEPTRDAIARRLQYSATMPKVIYQEFVESSAFLGKLDPDAVHRLAELSDDHAASMLLHAIEHTTVDLIDGGRNGLALIGTPPMGTLRPVYSAMYTAFISQMVS